jgi:outer membrane biosynthesis protein TonB
MSIRMHNPYEEPESSNKRVLLDLLLLSLLAHAVIITAILLIAAVMPIAPAFTHKPPPESAISLSLMAPPPKKPIFIPTTPDPEAQHKQLPVESANDTNLRSKSQTARKPDSIMPDVTGKKHAPNLNNAPNVQAPPKQEVSSTPPTPKQDKPQKPTPPQPNPQQAQKPPTTPPTPKAKPLPPTPPKPTPPQVDPLTGLPVLPPLAAPTMAPPNSAAPPMAPAPSQVQQAASVHGALGRQGDNSPAAMATELGKYKQYMYNVVGSYWYPDVNDHFGTIGVGMVHIQFTIHSDGTMTDVIILEGGNLEILKGISKHALVAPAPFKPFSDAMIKEVGDSYTDDFTFSVY